jgi:hypothetical protein
MEMEQARAGNVPGSWSVLLQHYQCFHEPGIFSLILHIKYGSSIGQAEIFDLTFWSVVDSGFDELLKELQKWPATAFDLHDAGKYPAAERSGIGGTCIARGRRALPFLDKRTVDT